MHALLVVVVLWHFYGDVSGTQAHYSAEKGLVHAFFSWVEPAPTGHVARAVELVVAGVVCTFNWTPKVWHESINYIIY